MFGFLKKKIAKVVESLKRVEKDVSEPVVEEVVPETENIEEPVIAAPEVETVEEPVIEEVLEEKEDIEEPVVEPVEIEEKIETKIEEPVPEIPIVEETVKEAIPELEKLEESISEDIDVSPVVEEVTEIEHIQEVVVEPIEVEEKIEIEKPVIEEPIVEEPVAEVPVVKEKKSFFRKLKESVVKKVSEKKLSEKDIDPILDELKTSMIEADVAVEISDKIKRNLKTALLDSPLKRGKEKEVVVDSLRKSLLEILNVENLNLDSLAKEKKPVVIAFWGFNGAGKTTSLAKTAAWLKKKGYSCVFAAADTFRAGAEEQLEIHSKNIGVKMIKHKYGADPAAVIFDAIEHAKAKGIDFVLADTAGRAHTNNDLMDQMRKVIRVNKPDVKILVIDSLIGNDAVMQARMYNEIGVDALVFTKVDVNEKGGAILSVTHELKKPILFLGMGQEYSDFQEFDAGKFVDNVLS